MTQKTFDCVELQRNIRSKLVEDANEDINKFFQLIKNKKVKSSVYQKLNERKQKQILAA